MKPLDLFIFTLHKTAIRWRQVGCLVNLLKAQKTWLSAMVKLSQRPDMKVIHDIIATLTTDCIFFSSGQKFIKFIQLPFEVYCLEQCLRCWINTESAEKSSIVTRYIQRFMQLFFSFLN